EARALTLRPQPLPAPRLSAYITSRQPLLPSCTPFPYTTLFRSGLPGHSFTAAPGNTQVDVNGWTLSSLTILTVNDVNFTLTATATVVDVNNETSTAFATESVTVNPKAPGLNPVAAQGNEDTAITLNLGVTVNSLTGDSNSLQSLVVNGIPVGDTLSDGHGQRFAATAGTTQVDVSR